MSPEEKLSARRLIAHLAGKERRVKVHIAEMARRLSEATRLPVEQSAALLEAVLDEDKVSLVNDGERIRIYRKCGSVVVTRRPPPSEAELALQLIAASLADNDAWARTMASLTADIAERTGLTDLEARRLIERVMPDGATLMTRTAFGVVSVRRGYGCVTLQPLRHNRDGKLEPMPLPYAVTAAREVAALYGVLPARLAA